MTPLERIMSDLNINNHEELSDFIINAPEEPLAIELRSGLIKYSQLSLVPVGE
ncbi:MAG: hypothetical protein WBH77_10320 [Saccharofermentanales bacterium]